ncbi:alpha-amylase family protein [Caproiciproducens faecalis]|uniref:Glycosyl hydrolase-like 10 domain-containing protein n=1 Tax=Caproiciproducens faecalis TaxID=2820301 RepID=A0ABS7DJ64_9FIRM|nr:hypothetical protein [Caproiciproducens faecalis]MBW7571335.1 hypothetical protein [Caproiciproducens faecalis]
MAWWLENRMRMIQNNLRDIDAQMDIDYEIQKLKEFGANVVQVGCGGITSFFPSELDCQYRNPYMKGDFFGELIQKCHENGIRVIARFDFSKTHESFYSLHKDDWYVKSIQGEPIRYHDTIATCVNGKYQQACSHEILKEALIKYPIDGVFFNMFGYINRDYSGNYTGICQCDSCRKRFKDMYGYDLPIKEDMNDPVYRLYKKFQIETVEDILDKIRTTVKAINPDIAVSTYNHNGVDIIRNESNSAVDRPYPFWVYQSSLDVSEVEGTFDDKVSSNCFINAVDLPYRFMGVSKYLGQIRLYENIASGSGLDWCIIGSFEDYPDRENYESVKEVFHFHQKYEKKYFGNFTSQARILLVNANPIYQGSISREFLGIFKMLKEEHRLFRVVERFALDRVADQLDQYDVVIIPGIPKTGSKKFDKAIESTTARVIATGLSFEQQPEILSSVFGVELGDALEPIRGTYMMTEPKSVFKSFENRDWVYLDKEFRCMKADGENEKILPLVKAARFGPPERCFGHEACDLYCVSIKNGRTVYFPWQVGTLYFQHGYEDFKYLLLNTIDHVVPNNNPFVTNAPKNVEVFFDKCEENTYIVQFINLSGFNGTTFFEPNPIHDLEISFPGLEPTEVFELGQDAPHVLPIQNRIHIDKLTNYRAFIVKI